MGSCVLYFLAVFITSAVSLENVSLLPCYAGQPEKDYITRCDFNDNSQPFCDWVQVCESDSGEWIRAEGETPTQHTGPSQDYPAPWANEDKKGYYIYQEASNFVQGQFIHLESPPLNLTKDVCVEFSYHMYGLFDLQPMPDSQSKLKVLARNRSQNVTLWERALPQSHAWLEGSVTIPASNQITHVIFLAERGLSERADVAVDNIAIVSGPCPSCIYGCDFDEAQCGWTTEIHMGDDNDEGWIWGKPSLPDFSKPGFGKCMLLTSEFNQPGHIFHLKSPPVNSTECLALSFHYYLHGNASTMALSVYAEHQGSTGMSPLLNIKNKSDEWVEARAVYCGVETIQFVFEGVAGEKISEIAVDKVCIVACCNGAITCPDSTTTTTTEPTTTPTAESSTTSTTDPPTTPTIESTTTPTIESTTTPNAGPTTTPTIESTTTPTIESTTTPTIESTTTPNAESTTTTSIECTTTPTIESTTTSTTGPTTTPTIESTTTTSIESTTTTTIESTTTSTIESTTTITIESTTTPNAGPTTTPTIESTTTPTIESTTTPTVESTTTPTIESTTTSTTGPTTTPTIESTTTTSIESTTTTTIESTTTPNAESTTTTSIECTTTPTTESTTTTSIESTTTPFAGPTTTPTIESTTTTSIESTTTPNAGPTTTPTVESTTTTTTESTTTPTTGPTTTPTAESTTTTSIECTTTPTIESTTTSTTGPTTTPTIESTTTPTIESTTTTTTGPTTTPTIESTTTTTTELTTTPTIESTTTTSIESTTTTTIESTTTPNAESTTTTSIECTTTPTIESTTTTSIESTTTPNAGPTTTPTVESTTTTTTESTTTPTTGPTTTPTAESTTTTSIECTTTPTIESTTTSTTGPTTTPTIESTTTPTIESTTTTTTGPTTTPTIESTTTTTTELTTTPTIESTTTTTTGPTTTPTIESTTTTSIESTTTSTTSSTTTGPMLGSCIISGDPHYITFDNRNFIFLGTCTYTLTRTCQKGTGPWFTIEGKNEERGLPGATYLRKLYLTIDGVTITLMKNRRILVDQKRIHLPKTVGHANLSLSGQYVIVNTDFGLQLQYDGNHFVKIQIPSSYKGKMCGLCGDFNDIQSDDYRKPDGTMAVSDTVFGDSWKTKDDEEERCRSIDPNPCKDEIYDKVIGPDQCGLITDTQGPFRECVHVVDPKPYFDNCVYDMCQFQGLQTPLCDQLQAYTDACRSAGATVHNWRTDTFCAPDCPPNSHYDLCVSQCPATCVQPNGGGCSSKCLEGCACDPGYVLSDSKCVYLSDCGCTDQQGDYHMINESWYLSGCSEVCTCISPKNLICQETKCSDSEQCGLQDGVYGCHPKGQETCSASGDPHYRTFDKVYYDFMGNCTYTFSKLCHPKPDLPHFKVETSNEHRGSSTRVSYVKAVHVEVYSHNVTLAKGRQVIVDGKLVNLPVLEEALQIRISGGYVSLETAFGLRVRYDGNHHVDVTVPSSYAGQLCGLCGNYNGLSADDKRMPNNQDADSFEELGASWLVPGTPTQCTHDKTPPDCDDDKFKESWNCGFIKDPKGPFRECNKHIPADQYFKDCVLDMSCGPHDETVSLCFALQTYADACAQAGIPVSWRNKTFCPLSCPAGSHYESCGNACPASCTDLSAPNDCTQPCVEGCTCNPGYVLSGDRCVPFEQCGCVDPERNYHQMGEIWFTYENCTERCTCNNPSNITCEPWQCGFLEICKIQDGVLGCYPLGSASCHVAGDPHYYTFDKAMHTFLGTCTYTLVSVCNTSMVTPFTVSAKNEERGLTYASYLSEIYVDVRGLKITLQKSGRMKLDDMKIRTPFEDNIKGISIYTTGIYTILETKFGLMVRFDGNHHLEIKLPSSYYGKLCGMCGNFNNDPNDDLLMPNGLLANNVPQFGNSWQVRDDDDDSRCYSDDRDDLNPPCMPGEESKLRSQCGELLSAKYSQCHSIVDPTPFIENCVFDLCTYGGMISTLCNNIQSYAEVCKSKGIDIKWRNNTFCPLACGKNSHYTECASPCPATCIDIYAGSTCNSNHTCAEGCECDSGFVLSGDLCARLEDCGCLDYNDDYYQSGDKWLNKRCDTKCTCNKGHLSCKAHKCSENSVCALKKDGRYGCRPVSFETCLISGDPHYLTFDGLAHHFQGKRTYVLVTTYLDSEALQPFTITGRNRVRSGNKKVSYLSEVHIEVYGHLIEFHRKKRLLLDDEELTPPYKSHEGFHIYQKSRTLYLDTDFGLSVNFDGKENADIIIPSLYKKKVRGLCGNYDGKYRNDFMLPNGDRVSNLQEFGNSWEVDQDNDDDNDDESEWRMRWTQPSNGNRYRRRAVGEDTDPEPETGYEACMDSQHNSTASCGALWDPQGPFRDCHPFIPPDMYYQNCLFDLCQTVDPDMLCTSFENYVQACQMNGTTLLNWRIYTNCVMDCPPNSSYKPCMDACPPTCANLAATSECNSPCMEGCQCDKGFVYSGFECVPYRSCGCTHRNKYYEVGERFVTADCTEECFCSTTQTIQCTAKSCPANTTCKVIDFKRACVSTCNNDTCQNGGTCKETIDEINCMCPPLYRGKYCEDNTLFIVVTALIPILVLLLIATGMILYFCCRSGGKGDSDSLSDVGSVDSFGEMTNLTPSWRVNQGSGVTNPRYQ